MARWPRLVGATAGQARQVTVLWERAQAVEDDLRLYRNLLALLPFAVRTRRVVFVPPPTSVVYYKPARRKPGRHLGWD